MSFGNPYRRRPSGLLLAAGLRNATGQDFSSYARAPTVGSGVTFTGGVANFDGSTNAVATYPDAAELEAVPLTVAMWVKINSGTTARCSLLAKHSVTSSGAAARGWYVHWSPAFGHAVAFVEDGVTKYKARVSNRTTDNNGVWRHLAVTIDTYSVSSGWVLYVNAASVTFSASDGAAAPTTMANTEPLMIGGMNWQSGTMTRLSGSLQDVRIYNRVLSAVEIAQIYAQTSGVYRP